MNSAMPSSLRGVPAADDLPVWLFVAYGGGHVKALLPVALRAQAQGIARVVFLALTTAAPIVREAGLPAFGFADLLEVSDTQAQQHGQRLVDTLEVQAAQRDESIAYLGLSYAELESEVGAQEAAARYAQYGRQAFLPVRVLERALRRWQPACVLATNSPRAERAALLAARRQGVPSLCLLDLFGLWEREWLVRPDYADALCVLNPQVAASLVAGGRPAPQVHVTGNPAFDGIHDPAAIARGQALRRDAGWPAQRVFLYASSPEPEEVTGIAGRGDPAWPRRVEAQLVEAVQADPSLALWVRRHPSEASAESLHDLGHPRIRVAEGPLHPYLHACDEVVVTVSTVGVEARLAGRDVTQVRGSILDGLSPYLAMGIARRALRLDEIGTRLPQPAAASGPDAGLMEGQAAARVLAVARSLSVSRAAA
ncbi:MAG: hypothetical protein RIS88_2050 [Pseudomonadota bacterium]|jgi:hypothetical protein